MHFCRDPQFVFLPNPKTATRATLGFMSLHFKVEMWKGEDRQRGTHFSGIPKEMQGWPSFTVVRNPYTRMASLYWTARHMPKFWDWEITRYLNKTFRPQTKYGHADYILKFEEIPECFKVLPFWRTEGEFTNFNNSKTKEFTRRGEKWKPMPDHDTLLTPKVREIIRKKYACDFEAFGYKP